MTRTKIEVEPTVESNQLLPRVEPANLVVSMRDVETGEELLKPSMAADVEAWVKKYGHW